VRGTGAVHSSSAPLRDEKVEGRRKDEARRNDDVGNDLASPDHEAAEHQRTRHTAQIEGQLVARVDPVELVRPMTRQLQRHGVDRGVDKAADQGLQGVASHGQPEVHATADHHDRDPSQGDRAQESGGHQDTPRAKTVGGPSPR